MSQWDKEAMETLRGAVYRGDGTVVVDVVGGRLTDDVLQLAGDGLRDAVAQDVEGAAELAAQCVSALRERGWWGDEELATVQDPDIADRLEIAITGKGAFRRFKDVLSRWPEELRRYFVLRDERQRGRARAWLAGEGYRPAGAARRA